MQGTGQTVHAFGDTPPALILEAFRRTTAASGEDSLSLLLSERDMLVLLDLLTKMVVLERVVGGPGWYQRSDRTRALRLRALRMIGLEELGACVVPLRQRLDWAT
jgi:hypothetical protein